jgi:rSAM/selenodomain-associated transferase 2
VSIVVPLLDDTPAAVRLLATLPPDPAVDIVLVDGGHDPGLDALARGRDDIQLVRCLPGRGRQLDAGAARARGAWLWFLHADSRVPPGWRQAFDDAPADINGGWFRFALDSTAWQARVLEHLVAWRVRVLRLPYGDQGIFARREAFARLGGFGDLPLMEDVAFVRRLVRAGAVLEPPLAVVTSARRWERDGWLRRSLRNITLLTLYRLGCSPARLTRWY